MDRSHLPGAWKSRRQQEGIIKVERGGQNRTVVNLKYDEEPALQSRRHKPDTTSSLKESSGATEGVLDSGVLRCLVFSIWARLMGREDKAKDYPRGWVGLLYAWAASLVSGCTISFLCKPTMYNPRPLLYVYKPESLVRRGYHNNHRPDS